MINQWGTWSREMAVSSARYIMGIMSGTSADALDLALVKCTGSGYQTTASLLQSASVPWPPELRKRFFALAYDEQAPLVDILELDREISEVFAREISHVVHQWQTAGLNIDAIGFSGQTVFHRGKGHVEGEKKTASNQPETFNLADRSDQRVDSYGSSRGEGLLPPVSLQLGNPAHIARETGIPVIAEFRKDHLALGFEGAPLSPLAEVLLYSSDSPRATLNLGGISNITLLAARNVRLTNDEKSLDQGRQVSPVPGPFASDAGPANTLLDRVVRRANPGEAFDRDGIYASRGRVIPALLNALLTHPFFSKKKPLSTGPEEFTLEWLDAAVNHVESKIHLTSTGGSNPITFEDKLRTLCEVTAVSIKKTLLEGLEALVLSDNNAESAPDESTDFPLHIPLFVSGGGTLNPVLMDSLRHHLASTPFSVTTSEELGMNSDMKEAVLFAVLANERIAGIGWIEEARQFCLGSLYFPV